jgi:hypothetical protein
MNKVILASSIILLLGLFIYLTWNSKIETKIEPNSEPRIESNFEQIVEPIKKAPSMNYTAYNGIWVNFLFPENVVCLTNTGVQIILGENGFFKIFTAEEARQVLTEPLERIIITDEYINVFINIVYYEYITDKTVASYLNLDDTYSVKNESGFTSYKKFFESNEFMPGYYVYCYISNTEPGIQAIIKYDEAFKEEFDNYTDIFEQTVALVE